VRDGEPFGEHPDGVQSAAQFESGWSVDWSRVVWGALTVVLATAALVAVFYSYGHDRTTPHVGRLPPRVMGH
jgi:hypothetical protein